MPPLDAPVQGLAVSIQGLSLRYPSGSLAIRDASLSLDSGEFFSLVGPSGCGKSSLLRVVAGLTQLTNGRVRVAPRPEKGDIGIVFQDATLLPWRTAQRNVELPLELHGVPEAERSPAALAMLERVELADASERLPRELSGGMRMRVALARAAVSRPKLLLLDEPFAAVDEMTRERLQALMMKMWMQSRFSAIFVTHSIREAVFLGERVGVMSRGPGELSAIIDVPFSFPREDALRTDGDFNDTVRRVASALVA